MEALAISLPSIIVCTERILLRSYAKVYAAFPHEGFFVLHYTNFIFLCGFLLSQNPQRMLYIMHAIFLQLLAQWNPLER